MAPPCALPHLHLKNIFALLQTIRVHFFVIVFFFLLLFFGFLENYSAHPRGAVEVTVTDGKREACCHREKVRERKKKSCENEEGKKNTALWRMCGGGAAAAAEAAGKLFVFHHLRRSSLLVFLGGARCLFRPDVRDGART